MPEILSKLKGKTGYSCTRKVLAS